MKNKILALIFITALSYAQEDAQQENQNNNAIQSDTPIEEVVVAVSFIPDEKRDTSEISSTLSSESMSIAGDSEASDALKRVTGLSLVKGKYVYVRGLGERYSSALLNGVLLPSPEPLKRVVPFDIFPTSILDNVLVQKTYSAQYPGEFGGGVIDMRTKLIPNEEFYELSVSTTYDSLATGTEGDIMAGYDDDWTGFDTGYRDLPESLAPLYENSDFISLATASYFEIQSAAQGFSGQWLPEKEEFAADIGFDFAYGNSFRLENYGNLGVIISAGYDSSNDYQPDISRTNYSRGTGDALVAMDQYEVKKSNKQVDTNLLTTIGWDINNQNYLQFTGLIVRKTDNRLTVSEGRNVEADFNERRTKMEWVERSITSSTLSGKHDFDNGLSIDWRTSFATGKRNSPFEREYFYEFQNGAYEFSRRQDSNYTNFSWLNDNSNETAIDFMYPIETDNIIANFKFGLKTLEKERDTDVKRYAFLPDFTNGALFADRDFRRQPINVIMNPQNFRYDRTGLVLTELSLNTDRYEGEMTVDAWYVSFESDITEKLSVSIGARNEESLLETNTLTFFGGSDVVQSTDELDKLLPALTATYQLNESMQVRFGMSETISRPMFREMSPVLFVNFETDRLERGFEGIKSSEIENLDLRYEWYFGFDEFLTISYFTKDFINPIEQVLEAAATSSYVSYRNALSAELQGAEFEFQKQFGELISGYDFFGKINYTVTDSNAVTNPEFITLSSYDDRPLVGQPDNILNIQFGYYGSDDSRLSVIYNDVGKRIRELGSDVIPNVMEDLPETLDMVYKKTFRAFDGNLDLTIKLRNLLEEPYEALQGDRVFETYSTSSSISIGLKYSY
tara:strand:+ start:524 stop:3070 length:2547 start_codon:yes stop_codon:yes gene_type:complete